MKITYANVKVVGGQMHYKRLTNKLEKRIYDISKAYSWVSMINDNMKPKKWYKPNAGGTKVTFDSIESTEELEVTFEELKTFIQTVNEEHGTDLVINLLTPKGEKVS